MVHDFANEADIVTLDDNVFYANVLVDVVAYNSKKANL